MRLLLERGSAELREVASGSTTQSLWLGDRKVRSQAIREDQSRFPGRGTVGKVSRGGRRSSDSLTFFIDRFFNFSGQPGFRMTFDAAERNERFGCIQCQRSKESSSRGKGKSRVFLCRKTV